MSDERLSASDESQAGAPASSTEREGAPQPSEPNPPAKPKTLDLPPEYGGRKGPEPVRYGDWEKNGRCIDF
ncbi:hypothetical protein SSPSH_002896 [Salinisphaera shabanensis E1L3A]|jgi:hypothetical protein|uniref:DUF1674 domain-containing protein n=1 Tax=Salinisphaera shabanensis E1L3A TaxID=1033802 RepID=U2FVC1_9GAMM|nr:DUF1674 domain-containing protein [Salinisphaera shabanensis]ERJ18268.1 hypothetical protein SSPSH_002896 [Salinisphaera shabanensis E1L3A]